LKEEYDSFVATYRKSKEEKPWFYLKKLTMKKRGSSEC